MNSSCYNEERLHQLRSLPLVVDQQQVNQMVLDFGNLSLIKFCWYKIIYRPKWALGLLGLVLAAGSLLLSLPMAPPKIGQVREVPAPIAKSVDMLQTTHREMAVVREKEEFVATDKSEEQMRWELPEIAALPTPVNASDLRMELPTDRIAADQSNVLAQSAISMRPDQSIGPVLLNDERSEREADVALPFKSSLLGPGDQQPDMDLIVQPRRLKAFRNIRAEGPVRIVLVESDTMQVTVQGKAEMIDLIKTKVSNQTLKISVHKNFSPAGPYDVYIEVPQLKKLTVRNQAVVYAADQLYIQSKDLSGDVLPLKRLEDLEGVWGDRPPKKEEKR